MSETDPFSDVAMAMRMLGRQRGSLLDLSSDMDASGLNPLSHIFIPTREKIAIMRREILRTSTSSAAKHPRRKRPFKGSKAAKRATRKRP